MIDRELRTGDGGITADSTLHYIPPTKNVFARDLRFVLEQEQFMRTPQVVVVEVGFTCKKEKRKMTVKK